jgi:hypothetical protein
MGLVLAVALAIAPSGARADEAQETAIATQIAQRLKQSGRLQGYRIGVKYKDGVAWLVGTVANDGQLASAIAIAEQTAGVDYVVNRLELASPSTVATDGAVQQVGLQQPTPAQPIAQARPMQAAPARQGTPLPMAMVGGVQQAQYAGPLPAYTPGAGGAVAPVVYDSPNLPGHAWPAYAASPNYAAVTYPKQYSPTAFPFIGPFYPYPQVPLGWRRVALEWDDGWWMLDFHERHRH